MLRFYRLFFLIGAFAFVVAVCVAPHIALHRVCICTLTSHWQGRERGGTWLKSRLAVKIVEYEAESGAPNRLRSSCSRIPIAIQSLGSRQDEECW